MIERNFVTNQGFTEADIVRAFIDMDVQNRLSFLSYPPFLGEVNVFDVRNVRSPFRIEVTLGFCHIAEDIIKARCSGVVFPDLNNMAWVDIPR